MRRLALGCGAAVLVLLGGVRLDASHPIFWYDLELVPELSTLTVTGGFAGVHQTYRVDGRLGLNFDPHPHPPETTSVDFGLVDATLHGEGFFDGEDLDRLLAMTGWEGVLIEEGLLSFTGEDGQEAPITAVAELNGSRLRIRGSNLPGCCDFFNYSWDLFALTSEADHGHAHADFDEDRDVDGDDLISALVNFGMKAGADHAHGDADADGDVDRLDLTLWRTNVASGLAGSTLSAAAVPEPTSLAICVAAALVWVWRRAPSSTLRARAS